MSDSAVDHRRTQARDRKRLQRERQRERARIAAIEEAWRQEISAEFLAPAIRRNPITTEAAVMLVGSRIAVINGKACHTDPIARSKSSHFKDRHRRAARRLQQDWHDVGAGIGVGGMDYLRAGGGAGMGGHVSILAQIQVRADLDGALTFAGAFAPSLARVVLDCIPIAIWVLEPDQMRAEPRTEDEGAAWIAAGLDRIAEFYWPEGEKSSGSSVVIRRFGPPRQSYTTGIDEV